MGVPERCGISQKTTDNGVIMGRNWNIVCFYLSGHLDHSCSCTSPPNSEVSTSYWWTLWTTVLVQQMSQPSLSVCIKFGLPINYLSRYFVHWIVHTLFGPLCTMYYKRIQILYYIGIYNYSHFKHFSIITARVSSYHSNDSRNCFHLLIFLTYI
jgi:hypothetical protein